MVGQCSALERKSIEPMALHVDGGNIRGMQRCMSDDVWDEDPMRQTSHGLVAREMGDPQGVLIVDESGFVKKGKESVGVARQYCGTLGKVDNSQVGVFAAYASRHGYALVDKRLFMPEQWFSDAYAERRHKCQVPAEVTFHTKPRVAASPTPTPLTVMALAESLPSAVWYRRTVSEGTKGPIAYAFARKRVTLCKEGLPERTVWLVIKRTLGASPTYAYYMSNAPASTPLRLFVWLSGIRWAIEQCFEETKTELGMAHYEVRKYPGWHHHILTGMLAHFFLWHLQIRLE